MRGIVVLASVRVLLCCCGARVYVDNYGCEGSQTFFFSEFLLSKTLSIETELRVPSGDRVEVSVMDKSSLDTRTQGDTLGPG